jgi:hypothetical protein
METFHYTLTRSLSPSALEHLAAAAGNEELSDEEDFELEVEFSVYGDYRPATYWEPAESPELEIRRVVHIDENDNETEFALTRKEERDLESAIWEYLDDIKQNGYY